MKNILLIIVLSLAASCTKEGVQTSPTNNTNFGVTKLFDHEDCSVYRFNDGHYIYYTNCKKSTTMYKVSCGKNCIRNIQVD